MYSISVPQLYPQKLADRLKRVIPSNQVLDPNSTNFSVERFLSAQSLENFCENVWTLADHVVNKRVKEPAMFKVGGLHVQCYVHLYVMK